LKISLVPIDIDNWKEVIELDVTNPQKKFVRSNVFTIAEANFYPNAKLRGIEAGGNFIGLAFYGFEPEDGKCWLLRIMIDQRYQNQGYGRKAIELIIDDVRKSFDTKYFYLSVVPKNSGAIMLYEDMGFEFMNKYKDLGWTPPQKVYRITL
jgi:diamine N-acetyltransferase